MTYYYLNMIRCLIEQKELLIQFVFLVSSFDISASKIRSCKYNYRIKFEFLMGLEFFNLEGFQIVAFLVRKLLIDRRLCCLLYDLLMDFFLFTIVDNLLFNDLVLFIVNQLLSYC